MMQNDQRPEPRRGLLRRAWLLVALPLLAACGGSANLTPEQEYYSGRAMSANVLASYSRVYDDPVLTEYVYLVGTLVAMCSERAETFRGPYNSYRFTILDEETPNAFGAPSGFVFITKGLIRKCETEDELAAILAHEVTHIVLKHPEDAAAQAKRNSDAQKGVGAVGSIISLVGAAKQDEKLQAWGGTVTDFATAMDEICNIFEKGFSREQEYAADAGALVLLARVGYDPLALKRMLQRLGERKTGVKGWAGDTHPAPQERVQEIDKELARRQAEGKPLRGSVVDARTARYKKALAGMK
jgi:predicted Zn-dependent protease